MTLFPKSRVHDYLLLYPLPDDLDYLNNLNSSEHHDTIDELINYSQTLIKFLEINKVYGEIYLAGSALFESLFSKFAYYYRQQSHLRQTFDRRFELIRLEQTIHLLNSSIGTQDISGYLGLVDENCDNPKIVQLLILLEKKFDYFYEGYSQTYASFANFLAPFLHWVAEMKFEYVKLLNMVDNEETVLGLVRKNMAGLKEALAKRKVNIHVEEERLADWGYVKEKLEEIKGLIVNEHVKRDEKYYQELGLYSFLAQLGKFALEKDLTFVKICVISSMYLEGTFKGLTNVKDMPKTTISGLEKLDFKLDFIPEMLRELIKKKQDKNLDIEERLSWLELICCTLNLVNNTQAIKNFGAFIREEGEGEQQQKALLEELIDLVHTNEIVLKIKDAPLYAGYMRYYDYLVLELLILGERLCEQVGKETNEWKLINKTMIDKLMQKINPEELKGVAQERYYARIQEVDFTAFKVENFARLVQAKDRLNLVRNLNHTQKLLMNDSAKHIANAEVCACLLQAFKFYKVKIEEEIKGVEELEVLKNIGIFMLGLMNMKIPGLEEIKEDFILALLGFLGQKCQLNKWDIFNLQRSLGLIMYKFKASAKIWKEKALYQLIGQIEGEIGSSGKITKVLLNAESLMKDEEIKEKLFEIVTPSIEGIEKGLLELWGNSPQIWEINENSKGIITRIREYCRRYIFYCLPWTACLSKGLRPKSSEKDKEKLLWILNKVISLSFHPAFTLFLYASERRILLEGLASIIQCNSYTRWCGSLVYCRVIKDQINALESLEPHVRQEFIKETKYQHLCLPNYKENKVYSQNINRSVTKFHSLMSGISELSGLFHWVEACPLDEKQQEEVLEGVKGLLEAVWGFVGEFNKEFRGERFEEHNEKIKQGVTVIVKSFNKMTKSYGIFYESFYEILSQALKGCDNDEALMEFLGYILKHVGGEIQRKSLMYFVSSLGLWEPMLKKLREGSAMKGLNEIFNVDKLIEEKDLNGKIQEMVELQGMNGTIAKEYVKTLFEKIDGELKLVPFWEIILKKDSGFGNVFYSILKTYEECFVFLLREKEENIEEIKARFYEKVEQGIEIYSFDRTKGEESEVEMVAKCQQKAKLRIVKTVYEFNLGLVRRHKPGKFEELAVGRTEEIKEQVCDIEKANNYLRYLRVILNHEDKKEIEFDMPLDTLFWSIYEAGVVIIQEAAGKDANFSGVLQETLELLLPYFMNNFYEKRNLQKQCDAIYKLVGLIYEAHEKTGKELICPNGDLFRNLMKMLLVAFYSDKKTGSEVLLGEKSLLKSLLEVESKEIWKTQAVDIVLLVFNAFIEDSLPMELMAEMRIKGVLLASGTSSCCKLTDLAKDPWVQDLEKTSENGLIELLNNRFKVQSSIQDVNDKSRYNAENLVVLLDEEKEEKDGQKKMEEILNKQSRQAQRALKMLMEVFIKNPESGILNVICGLFNKYRHLAITGAFQKEDFLGGNFTFMEILFKLGYQAQHIEDVFNLINVFGNYTGVTFLSSNGVLMDASLVLINKFLGLVRKDLQEKFNDKDLPSLKNYIRIINAVRVLGYLSSQTCKQYQGELYQKYIRGGAMKLLKVALTVLGRSRRLYEEIVKTEGANFIDILVKQLGGLYEERIVKSGLTKEKIEELKQDHYEKFLDEKELKEQVERHEDLVRFGGEFKRNEGLLVYEEINRGVEVLRNKGERVNLLRVPVRKETGVSVDEDWEGAVGNVIGDLKNLQEIYKKNEKEGAEEVEKKIEDLKKKRGEYFGQESEIGKMFGCHNLGCVGAFVLKKEVEGEVKEEERFYVKISNELKKTNGISNEQEEKKAEEKGIENKEEEEAKAEVAEEKKEEKQEEAKEEIKLKYFGNVNITEKKQFDWLKRKVNRALKALSERVQVRVLHSEQTDIEIIAQEILEEQGLLTKYEQNLLSCLGGQLESLREAFNGPEVDEMKVELTWIEENFNKYLEVLEKASELEEIKEIDEEEEIKGEEPGFLFEEGFEFCTEHPERTPSVFGKVEPKKVEWNEKATEVNGVFLADEEVVESVMGLLSHCKYEESLCKDTNKLTILLRELCNCAKFELQFIDLGLYLLYCAEGVENYPQFASNILQFLSYYLQRKEYLLYQPRVYLERHGHQGIKENKKKPDFIKKTSCMVSICDLLVGLLTVKEIVASPELLKETENLVMGVLAKVGNTMKIIEVQEGQELREEQRVITSKTCNRIFGLSKIDTVIKSCSEASIYGFKRLFRLLGTKIEILNSIIEEANLSLKNKIKVQNEKPTPNDIKTVLENLPSLAGLDELLGSLSDNVAPWFLNKTEVEEQAGGFVNLEERDKVYHKIIQSIDSQILKEKLTEDFILRLYELAAYLQTEEQQDSAQFRIVIGSILGICLHFYALVCIRDAYNKLQIHQNKENSMVEGEFPNLTKMLSTDSQGDLKELPELSHTFSHFRASRQFDYDLLFSDLVKKNRDLLSQMAYEDLNKTVPKYEILVICRRRPWILDFSSKKRILNEKILEDMRRIGSRSMRTISIDRKEMIESTIAEFSNLNLCTMRKKIKIEFLDEAGSDAGGLTREYFSVINRDLFDSKRGLFQLSANMASIQPNPLAKIVPSYLRLLELAGIMLAKAIQHECVVDVTLTKPLLKHILNRRLNINDMDDVDPELRKSLKWMLENSVEGLEQSFSYETEIFGQKITKELVADGYSKTVTDENKKEFVNGLCERKMKGEIQQELDAFLKGFYLIIPAGFLSLFSVSELQLLISGIPVIDIEEMKKYAKYIGYSETDPQIIWLWEIFGEFSQKELAAFVFFTSGSIKLSHESLKDRPFRYRKAGYGIDKLPISHTCSWEIEIPPYESKEDMRQKFMLAIFEGQESFMLN